MATITSQAAGKWCNELTWDTGTIPTSNDVVYIQHHVKIDTNITATQVHILAGGSLTVSEDFWGTMQLVAGIGSFTLYRTLNDTRQVNLDGVMLVTTPSITCSQVTGSLDGYPNCIPLVQDNVNHTVIISDPGYTGTSATLQDIKPEGCARAYARKVSNGVRYMTVTVRIKADAPRYLASLYRMAAGPFQVLVVTNTCVIKGYIETIAPDQSAVGTEYITVRVTVAEGA